MTFFRTIGNCTLANCRWQMAILALLMLCSVGCLAAPHTNYTTMATIYVTNSAGTANGDTLTIFWGGQGGNNGLTYAWTNLAVPGIRQLSVTNTAEKAATNLFNKLSQDYTNRLLVTYASATAVRLQTFLDGSLFVTNSAGWATNLCTTNPIPSNTILKAAGAIFTDGAEAGYVWTSLNTTGRGGWQAIDLNSKVDRLNGVATNLTIYNSDGEEVFQPDGNGSVFAGDIQGDNVLIDTGGNITTPGWIIAADGAFENVGGSFLVTQAGHAQAASLMLGSGGADKIDAVDGWLNLTNPYAVLQLGGSELQGAKLQSLTGELLTFEGDGHLWTTGKMSGDDPTDDTNYVTLAYANANYAASGGAGTGNFSTNGAGNGVFVGSVTTPSLIVNTTAAGTGLTNLIQSVHQPGTGLITSEDDGVVTWNVHSHLTDWYIVPTNNVFQLFTNHNTIYANNLRVTGTASGAGLTNLIQSVHVPGSGGGLITSEDDGVVTWNVQGNLADWFNVPTNDVFVNFTNSNLIAANNMRLVGSLETGLTLTNIAGEWGAHIYLDADPNFLVLSNNWGLIKIGGNELSGLIVQGGVGGSMNFSDALDASGLLTISSISAGSASIENATLTTADANILSVGGTIIEQVSGNITVAGGIYPTSMRLSQTLVTAAGVTTSDDTPTALYTFEAPNENITTIEATVSAIDDGSSAAASYTRIAAFRNNTGITQIGSTTGADKEEAGASAWDVTIDSSGSDLRVMVTGAAATDINWGVTVRITTATPF